jgi:hypothetical protein
MMYQDVDAMWEADAAAEWERLNEPDPYEKQLRDAALDLSLAIEPISKAEDYLMDAVADVSETPMEAKVAALLDSLEDLEYSIKALQEKYGKGERE